MVELPTNRPPVPSPGDELARQAGFGGAQQLAQAGDAAGIGGTGDLSFSQALTRQRESIGMADQNVQATTQRADSVRQYAGGEGFNNAQAVMTPTRAFGEDPAAALGARLNMMQNLRTATTGADSARTSAINEKKGQVDTLLQMLSGISTSLQRKQEFEQEKAQKDLDFKERQRQNRLEEIKSGFVFDEATGGFREAEPEDELMTPDGSLLDEEQRLKAKKKGADAVGEVLAQGGAQFIKGLNKDAQIAAAENILRTGGVQNYRKALPLESLLTPAELKTQQEQTDLLSKVDGALSLFQGQEGAGGTGPLARFLPGAVAGQKTRDMRRAVEDVRSVYQRAISGATVSDAEVKRLSAFLPTTGKNETQNAEDLVKLREGIAKNQQLFERAKQEGLTPNQAYEKYGKEVFGTEAAGGTKKPSRDEVSSKLKTKGYSQEDINAYLQAKGL